MNEAAETKLKEEREIQLGVILHCLTLPTRARVSK